MVAEREPDESLSRDVLTAIAQRIGTVHSYTLFTGYYRARIRGEMRSLGAAARRKHSRPNHLLGAVRRWPGSCPRLA